jgi:glyoxylase-like metal-dependent hydrolase (beta-lactamase superfamily II)
MPKLNWKLLTKKRESSTQGLPPGKESLAWVTNTVTLIYGERDAVLVDTFLSVQHSRELADWVAESSKSLIAIYVTHAHGDHFFGLKLLLDRFPNRKSVCYRFKCCRNAKPDRPRLYKILLGAAVSWPGPVAVDGAGDPRRRHALP